MRGQKQVAAQRADPREASAEGRDLDGMIGETIALRAHRAHAVGIDDGEAGAPFAGAPAPARAARRMARASHGRSARSGRAARPRRRAGSGRRRWPGRARARHAADRRPAAVPLASAGTAAARAATVAPLSRCSAAMPPTWSRCSCELRISRTSRMRKPSRSMFAAICGAASAGPPSIRTCPRGRRSGSR